MTKREMISLLIKLTGIYALVQLVPGLAQTLAILAEAFVWSGQPWSVVLTAVVVGVFAPILWIALCLAVVVKSDALAARLYRDDAPAGQLTTLGFDDLQRLGYNIIGLLLIVGALPRIVSGFAHYLIMREHWQEGHMVPVSQGVMVVTQLVIGLYLFLRPHGLANLWKRMQGRSNPFEENSNT